MTLSFFFDNPQRNFTQASAPQILISGEGIAYSIGLRTVSGGVPAQLPAGTLQ
jgi:hypothetical protein